jgi:hypothetical protein
MKELEFLGWEGNNKTILGEETYYNNNNNNNNRNNCIMVIKNPKEDFYYLGTIGDRKFSKICKRVFEYIYNNSHKNFSTKEEGFEFVDEFIENLNKFIKLKVFE